MTDTSGYELAIERVIDAPVAAVWTAYTDHLAEWFCPRPWTIELIAQDMWPGGRSAMVMRGPDGEESPAEGVYLEIVPQRRIVFTNAFAAGWVPQGPFMVGLIELTPDGHRTHYRASARHWSEETKKQHEAMGFHDGWNTVADQLEEVAKRIAAG